MTTSSDSDGVAITSIKLKLIIPTLWADPEDPKCALQLTEQSVLKYKKRRPVTRELETSRGMGNAIFYLFIKLLL